MVEAERLAQAAEAETYTEAEWRVPTPCPAWRVRELIAHLAQYGNPSWPPIAFARARFNRDRFVADVAVRIAAAHTDAGLMARLRDRASSQWRPPGVPAEGMLLDTIVHDWDIRMSLGRASAPARTPITSTPSTTWSWPATSCAAAGVFAGSS